MNVYPPGDPDPGSKAEPGFRSRGPGPEEPAAGEGEDVALVGGNQMFEDVVRKGVASASCIHLGFNSGLIEDPLKPLTGETCVCKWHIVA